MVYVMPNNNIYKRILALLLSILIIIMVIWFQYQEAKAFFPLIIAGIVLAPEIVACAGALLVAAGLVLATNSDVQNAATDFFYNVGRGTQRLIEDSVWAANELVSITDEVKDAVVSYVDSKFNDGTNVVDSRITYYEFSNGNAPASWGGNGASLTKKEVTLGNNTYRLEYDSATGNAYLYENGIQKQQKYLLESYKGVKDFGLCLYDSVIEGKRYLTASFAMNDNTTATPGIHYEVTSQVISQSNTLKINATATGVDAPRDWATTGGTRAIPKVTDTAQVVGLTATDVQNKTLTQETPTGTDITQSWLSGLLTGLLQPLQVILGDIKKGITDILGITTPWSETLNQTKENTRTTAETAEGIKADTGTIAETLTQIEENTRAKAQTTTQELVNTKAAELKQTVSDRMPIGKLQTSLQKINQLSTGDYKSKRPNITINLNTLFRKGVEHVNPNVSNPYQDKQSNFIDFEKLENITFAGFSIIEYFRTIIGAGFLWWTLLYFWHKIVPKTAISD